MPLRDPLGVMTLLSVPVAACCVVVSEQAVVVVSQLSAQYQVPLAGVGNHNLVQGMQVIALHLYLMNHHVLLGSKESAPGS